VDFNLFARVRMMRGFDSLAVDADVAFLDQPLQCAARGGGKYFAQELVEPFGRQRFLDGETFFARRHADQFAAGLGAPSFRQLMRKIRATPVQMAESATLKAGKSSGSPLPRRCK